MERAVSGGARVTSRRPRATWLFAAMLCVTQAGCVTWDGDIEPSIDTVYFESSADAPRVRVSSAHRFTLDGKPAAEDGTFVTSEAMALSEERILQRTRSLRNMRPMTPDPQYRLLLDTEIAERKNVSLYVSGVTLTIFPAFLRSDLIVRADLMRPDGTQIEQIEVTGAVRGVMQLLVAPFVWINLWTKPGEEYWDAIYVQAFAQVLDAIGRDQAAASD